MAHGVSSIHYQFSCSIPRRALRVSIASAPTGCRTTSSHRWISALMLARSVHGVLPVGRWGLARDDAGLLVLTHSTLNLDILTSTTYQPVSRKFAWVLFLTLRIRHRDSVQRKDPATSGEDLSPYMGLGLCSDVRPALSLQHHLGCPSIAILTSPTLGNCLSVWAICSCMSFTHSTKSMSAGIGWRKESDRVREDLFATALAVWPRPRPT